MTAAAVVSAGSVALTEFWAERPTSSMGPRAAPVVAFVIGKPWAGWRLLRVEDLVEIGLNDSQSREKTPAPCSFCRGIALLLGGRRCRNFPGRRRG